MPHRSAVDAQQSTTLDDLRQRIEATDLIPSQEPLLEAIADRFARLGKAGIITAVDLQEATKNKRAIAALADTSSVDADYLTLLNRAVRGFFPKPKRLKEFDWLAPDLLARLDAAGLKNTDHLRDAVAADPAALVERAAVTPKEQAELLVLADLCRVQWTSPSFARVLVAAGFDSAAAVANAAPEPLCDAVAEANERSGFYKGKIGLRDIKRLIAAAGYVASSDDE